MVLNASSIPLQENLLREKGYGLSSFSLQTWVMWVINDASIKTSNLAEKTRWVFSTTIELSDLERTNHSTAYEPQFTCKWDTVYATKHIGHYWH